jgi:hypothetical protein
MTNEAATDGDRGPPRPMRSTFYRHKQQKAERMKIRVGRAPRRGGGAAPSRGPFRRFAACCSLPQKVERIGRKADGAQDLCAQLTPAERPGRPPNHPRHPAPAPTAQPQNRPPRPGRLHAPGVGRVMSPSRLANRPTPREAKAWPACASRPIALAGVQCGPRNGRQRGRWWPSTTVLRPVRNARNPHVRFGPASWPHAKGVGHVPSVYPTLRDQPPARRGRVLVSRTVRS